VFNSWDTAVTICAGAKRFGDQDAIRYAVGGPVLCAITSHIDDWNIGMELPGALGYVRKQTDRVARLTNSSFAEAMENRSSIIEGFALRWDISEFVAADVMGGALLDAYRRDIPEKEKSVPEILGSFR
jgi:hypothetical protein